MFPGRPPGSRTAIHIPAIPGVQGDRGPSQCSLRKLSGSFAAGEGGPGTSWVRGRFMVQAARMMNQRKFHSFIRLGYGYTWQKTERVNLCRSRKMPEPSALSSAILYTLRRPRFVWGDPGDVELTDFAKENC